MFCECCGCSPPYSLDEVPIYLLDVEACLENPDAPAYRDLRSASRAENRQRKHLKRYNDFKSVAPIDCPSQPEQRSHYLPTCSDAQCPTHDTSNTCPFSSFPADLSTAPTAKFTKREAYNEGQRSRAHVGSRRRTRKNPPKSKHAASTWRWTRRRWEQRETTEVASRGWEDDVDLCWYLPHLEYCNRMMRWESDIREDQPWIYDEEVATEAILSWDEWTVSGETFSTNTDPDEDEGYHSSTSTSSTSSTPLTTLPTDPNDICGHKLLKDVLTIPDWVIRYRSWIKHRPLPDNHYRFSEYVWYWHRNKTGCWYVLDSPCGQNNWLCYREKWKGEEWRGWDPENGTECWLAELTKGDGWEGLWDEEFAVRTEECGDGKVGEGEEEWDLISNISASSSWTGIGSVSDLGMLSNE